MTTLVWKLQPLEFGQEVQTVWREWPDGRQESMQVTAPEYLEWLAAGNLPIPADAGEDNEPSPPDEPAQE
jgi:hypothetical protein